MHMQYSLDATSCTYHDPPLPGSSHMLMRRCAVNSASQLHAGKPVFGTLIALLQDGVPILGVIDQPITRERWIGIQGQGTTLNGELVCMLLLCKSCCEGQAWHTHLGM